jgi:hypothetical protein
LRPAELLNDRGVVSSGQGPKSSSRRLIIEYNAGHALARESRRMRYIAIIAAILSSVGNSPSFAQTCAPDIDYNYQDTLFFAATRAQTAGDRATACRYNNALIQVYRQNIQRSLMCNDRGSAETLETRIQSTQDIMHQLGCAQ